MHHATRFRLRLLASLAPLLPLGCADTVSSTDAGNPVDAGAPVDAGNPVDAGAPVDAGTPVDAGARVDAAVGCPEGRGNRRCLTFEQVEALIRNPPGERQPLDGGAGDAGPAPIDAARDPNGCYAPRYVQSGCCNPAYAVEREGDQCCYSWCDMACCGRPMLVAGEARAAEMVPASAWAVAAGGDAAGPDGATRAALARAWRDDGRMEHASVASFARFTLELLAIGAPPSLVAEAQQAALDEVEHARACLALASRLDGSTVGPGPLDVTGALDGLCAEKTLRDAIVEGCVGETVSALVAQAQLRLATEPGARAALARIAADEERHAGLAWRFVAWALGAHPGLRGVAERAFAGALTRRPGSAGAAATPGIDAEAWRAWGRLDGDEHAAAVREAIEKVIAPCARALFGATRSQPSPRAAAASP